MFIDSHLHLTEKDYDKPIYEVVNDAMNSNVKKLIVSCCEMSDLDESLRLLKYENIFLTIGLHPSEADSYTDKDIERIEEIAKTNDRVIAIGEIGLDYYYGKENKDKQIDLFRKQLDLAQKLSLPVVIHTRDAVEDTINVLKQYNLKGVIHCFNGSIETAKEYVKMGYLLGIGGVVTFKNSKLYQVIEELALENILLETDSPYLSPDRGKRNEPKNIPIIAEKISSIKNVDINQVGDITTSNAIELFDLKKFVWYIRIS